MKTPTCTVEQITPAMALEILDNQDKLVAEGKARQRLRSEITVMRYATDMHQKLWRLSPEPLIFDVNNVLLDGQQRLAALVRAKVTLPFYISRGWPSELIDVIDQGKSRSLSATLQIAGVPQATVLASCMTNFASIPFRGNSSGITYGQLQVLLHKMGVQDSMEAILKKAPNYKAMKGHVVGPLAWYHMVKPNKAGQFANEFFNFQTETGSPVASLLGWIGSGGAVRDVGKAPLFRATCVCLRAWDEGRKISKLVLSYEPVQWLADLNPELRDWCRHNLARGRKEYWQDMEAAKAAREKARAEKAAKEGK